MFEVGQNYKEVDFDVVIVSDLVRSRESAEAFLKGAGKENLIDKIIVNQGVTEINYEEDDGVAEAKVKEKKKKFFTENPDKNGDLSFAFPGAESFADAGERMKKTLKKIDEEYPGKKVLIISHSGSMRALVGNVVPGKDLNFGKVVKIKIDNEDGFSFLQ
jgi:broad specificity phosphatase PhoE